MLWPKPYRGWKSAKWSAADAVLLDELGDLIERTPSLGHVVVDEAQDLSPMQCARSAGAAAPARPPSSATSPRAPPRGPPAVGEALKHLGQDEGEVTELTLGFRVPREVLDYAARLLPSIAPALAPPRSLRPGVGSLTVRPAAR